ncbi:toxin-antitoxin system protein [Anaerofustis stercorihominis]|uniref:toxin-antitoxin system protein n=1 Tax=Anaerofustis stercorihominis TaxID=214853 RepID=UPI00325B0DF0
MKKLRPLKAKVSITLDEELIKDVKKLAEQDDRSFSQYINVVLNKHLMEIKKNDNKEVK